MKRLVLYISLNVLVLVSLCAQGSNIRVNDNNSIVPMIGLIHSWRFNEPIDMAAGFYWVCKKYSLYLWGNNFFTPTPRVTEVVDFTI